MINARAHEAVIGDGLEASRAADHVALGNGRRRTQDVARDVPPDGENVHAGGERERENSVVNTTQ